MGPLIFKNNGEELLKCQLNDIEKEVRDLRGLQVDVCALENTVRQIMRHVYHSR